MSKQFSVGDCVKWSSSANGSTKTKRGTVVAVVPAVKRWYPIYNLLGQGWQKDYTSAIDASHSVYGRGHESYLIAVPGKTPRSQPRLYWPRTSALQASAARQGGEE